MDDFHRFLHGGNKMKNEMKELKRLIVESKRLKKISLEIDERIDDAILKEEICEAYKEDWKSLEEENDAVYDKHWKCLEEIVDILYTVTGGKIDRKTGWSMAISKSDQILALVNRIV